jgi:regulator of nonsense transcripts 2
MPEMEGQILEVQSAASDDKVATLASEKPREKEKDDKDKSREVEDKGKEKEKEGEKKGEKEMEKEKVKGVEGASLDSLLQRLPGCVSRDLIDQLTVL